MKKVYVGLGNPGEEYENNRHNAGFLFIDYLIEQWRMADGGLNSKFVIRNEGKKLNSIIISVENNGQKWTLVKPQTYMNTSGEVVRKLLNFYKLSVEDLIVIYDDLDIRLGEFKIHDGIGPRSHNGVLSLEENLHTQTFTQVRIGVDNPSTRFTRLGQVRMSGEAYVLQDFTEEEKDRLLQDVFPKIVNNLGFL